MWRLAVVAIACGGAPARAPLANQPGSSAAAPIAASATCRALVARRYEPPTHEYVDATGRKIVVTTSDQCGLVIEAVYFERDAATFRSDAADELAGMLACLAQTERVRLRIDIIGHASADERDPGALASARADAVERYLRACGAPALGFAARSGLAEQRPEADDSARARDRRVDFLIVERTPP